MCADDRRRIIRDLPASLFQFSPSIFMAMNGESAASPKPTWLGRTINDNIVAILTDF